MEEKKYDPIPVWIFLAGFFVGTCTIFLAEFSFCH